MVTMIDLYRLLARTTPMTSAVVSLWTTLFPTIGAMMPLLLIFYPQTPSGGQLLDGFPCSCPLWRHLICMWSTMLGLVLLIVLIFFMCQACLLHSGGTYRWPSGSWSRVTYTLVKSGQRIECHYCNNTGMHILLLLWGSPFKLGLGIIFLCWLIYIVNYLLLIIYNIYEGKNYLCL